jgi:hypothetical protein
VLQATTVNGVATFGAVFFGARGRYVLVAEVGSIKVLSSIFDVGLYGRDD